MSEFRPLFIVGKDNFTNVRISQINICMILSERLSKCPCVILSERLA
jgi:hypothetical protein